MYIYFVFFKDTLLTSKHQLETFVKNFIVASFIDRLPKFILSYFKWSTLGAESSEFRLGLERRGRCGGYLWMIKSRCFCLFAIASGARIYNYKLLDNIKC